MLSNLTSELTKYRFIEQINVNDSYLKLEDFFNIDKLPTILFRIGEQMGSISKKVTASMIAKRMAFYGVIHLYAMSVMNKRLVVKIEEVKLVVPAEDKLWLPDFYFGDFHLEDTITERERWRETVVKELFSGFFHPLLEILRNETRFSKLVMWENIALYIFWLYESLLSNKEYQSIYDRLKEDFQFIIHEADSTLFGPYKNNPLSRFDSEKVLRDGTVEPIRIRKTCCLSNLLDQKDGKRCSTCPNGCNMPPF